MGSNTPIEFAALGKSIDKYVSLLSIDVVASRKLLAASLTFRIQLAQT